MATGDPSDMLARLRAVLPPRWFPDDAPVLTGLLTGLADAWSWLYGLLAAARAQARIATATGAFLDMIAADFFGARVTRRKAQNDGAFRTAILRELLRERGTRAALTSVLTDLTGRAPAIFESARPADTGAWNGVNGYGMAGGWGSLALPFQCLVLAHRPQGAGIASVAGYATSAAGYGLGPVEYASLAMLQGQVTDADIYAAAASVMPACGIAWMQITN